MSLRRVIGAAAVAVVAPLTLIAGSAQAATAPPSSITAKASDSTPGSGQTFRVNGLFMAEGKPAVHDLVKIQSWNGTNWVQIAGAQVDTTSTGTYQLRLILQAKGARTLRAVGIVPGPAQDAFTRFTVTVH